MLILQLILLIRNKNRLFDFPKFDFEPVSIIVPCYNESETIAKTIESLLNLDYPSEMIEIIIVDDLSKDNSVEIIKKYTQKHSNVHLIVNKINSGGAAEPTNIGIKAAKYEYIAVTDADSSPQKDALKKMIGFLQQDQKVAAVTCAVLAKGSTTFIQRLQSIEYVVIAFGRKLLDVIDSVYVTPGPFALYKKKCLFEVGLFDPKNLTQDIEIVWRLISHGYKARMSLSAKVYSQTPKKFKQWWKQRIRWNIGGTQCIIKHKKYIFRKGMLGAFIIPFFSLSLFLGLFGLGLFSYLFTRKMLYSYLSTKYSIYAQTAVLTFQDLSFTPSILNFLGAAMFILGAGFTMLVIGIMKEPTVQNKNIFNLLFYWLVYLTIYPLILIVALYKLITKSYTW